MSYLILRSSIIVAIVSSFVIVYLNYGVDNNVYLSEKFSTNSLSKENNNSISISRVDKLNEKVIKEYSKINSCYLPLLTDSLFFLKSSDVRFKWDQLFNDSLSLNNPYRNRYLVGDFMALNEVFESRGIEELNPDLNKLFDFKEYDNQLIKLLNNAENSSTDKEILYDFIKVNYPSDSLKLINFYEKVWIYKTPPFIRSFS